MDIELGSLEEERVIDANPMIPVDPPNLPPTGVEAAVIDLRKMLERKSMSSHSVHEGGRDGGLTLVGLGVVSFLIWLMFANLIIGINDARESISNSINGLKTPCNCVCPSQHIINNTSSMITEQA